MDHVAWLFDEAWERRRRRRRRRSWAWVGLLVCAAAVVTYAVAGRGSAPTLRVGLQEPAGTIVKSPSAVFSQSPYMGVLCPVPNSIACDQVGLEVSLKRQAYSVQASIDGRLLAMNRFGDQLDFTGKPRKQFDGYLRPAGIISTMHVRPEPGTKIWLGDGTPSASVWFVIDYGSGRHVTTHLQVPLNAGWG